MGGERRLTMENANIDIERLKNDLQRDIISSAMIGDFGGALLLSDDIDKMSAGEIVQEAMSRGMNLRDYIVEE